MKNLRPAQVLGEEKKVNAWIDIEAILYAVEDSGLVYIAMSDGEKLIMTQFDWAEFYDLYISNNR